MSAPEALSPVPSLPVLPVLLVDPLETNRALLALWIQAAAEELGIPCDIQALSDLPAGTECAGSLSGGVVLLSPLLTASWTEGAGEQKYVLWIHGEPSDGGAGDCSGIPDGARIVPWPVKRAGARKILAEAAILYGAARSSGSAAPFGQPVPDLLLPLVPRLVESVGELWEQCGAHIDNADYAEALRSAHSLKGAALSFGQQLLAECAGILMDALEKGNAEESARCRILMNKAVQMSAGREERGGRD